MITGKICCGPARWGPAPSEKATDQSEILDLGSHDSLVQLDMCKFFSLKKSLQTAGGQIRPLPAQRSFSTSSDGQIHPSPPRGHPPSLLVVKLTLPLLVVIIPPSRWRSTSRNPSPGYWCFKGRGVKGGWGMKRVDRRDGRREMGDERWKAGDKRRETGDGRWESGVGRREAGDVGGPDSSQPLKMLGIPDIFLSRHPTTSHLLKIHDTASCIGILPLRQWCGDALTRIVTRVPLQYFKWINIMCLPYHSTAFLLII